MAARHGRLAEVTIDSVDLSAFCDDLELSIDSDTAETTGFGSLWKSHIAGLLGAELSLSGTFDPTASTGPAAKLTALIIAGAAVAVVHKPGGTASGQRTNSFNALVTSYRESSSIGDKVAFSASLLVTGAVTPTNQ